MQQDMTHILAVSGADALDPEWLDWIAARSASAQYHWEKWIGWTLSRYRIGAQVRTKRTASHYT